MPSTATKNLTLSRTPFLQKIGVPEGLTPFIRHLHLLNMQHRKALGQLIRTLMECCKDQPDQCQNFVEDMVDDLIGVLKPTEEQQQDLIGLWEEYKKEIWNLTSPVVEAKVEEPDPSFTIKVEEPQKVSTT